MAKTFLDAELAKYESIKDLPRSLINLLGLSKRHKFEDLKTKGVGQSTILKFLGGNWKLWMATSDKNIRCHYGKAMSPSL